MLAPAHRGSRMPPLFMDRIIQIKGLRFDTTDCERTSIDKDVLIARRNKVMQSRSIEYKVLGWFKEREDEDGQADTFYLTMEQLQGFGLPRDQVHAALKDFGIRSTQRIAEDFAASYMESGQCEEADVDEP